VVIDAGSGARNLGKALLSDKSVNKIYWLFTHSHWDHVVGFPFFGPSYSPKYHIVLCGGPNSHLTLKKYLTHQMEPPYFPVDFSVLKAEFEFAHEFSGSGFIDSFKVISIPLSHPNGGYGYKLIEGNKSFVFLTDNELSFRHGEGLDQNGYKDFCENADLLFHDAQYTREDYRFTKGWGHSTYDDALELAIGAKVKKFGLFHHDPDRTDDDLDVQLKKCQTTIQQSNIPLDCFGVAEGMEIEI
jgi:ribonuclease BN (tRNA processing enzyme)